MKGKQASLIKNLKPIYEIRPYFFAIIEDWYRTSTMRGEGHTYGFLQNPIRALLHKTNNRRASISL